MTSPLQAARVVLARIVGHFRRRQTDRELDEELAAHLAMAEEEYVRRGRTAEEARRLARVDLGGLTQLREASREASSIPWLDAVALDLRLAFRILRKSWGVTLVGGVAMTVAMVIGGGAFNLLHAVMGSTLPLDEGDRVVSLMVWDDLENRRLGVAPADLERFEDSLRLVENIGGFRDRELSMTAFGATLEDPGKPVHVAEMSAAGFDLARVPPLRGRTLTKDDERADAAPVLVIGHDVWRSQFASDPEIVGRRIRLGESEHEVIGVMPRGFAFPIDHSFWTPLHLRSLDAASAPAATGIATFARLRDGAGLEAAQAELATLGLTRALYPAKANPPGLRVSPYPLAFIRIDGQGKGLLFSVAFLLAGLLLLPPCANVAILVYARTGSERGRINSCLECPASPSGRSASAALSAWPSRWG